MVLSGTCKNQGKTIEMKFLFFIIIFFKIIFILFNAVFELAYFNSPITVNIMVGYIDLQYIM